MEREKFFPNSSSIEDAISSNSEERDFFMLPTLTPIPIMTYSKEFNSKLIEASVNIPHIFFEFR